MTSLEPLAIIDNGRSLDHLEHCSDMMSQVSFQRLEESSTKAVSNGSDVIISIKPRFSNLIFRGEKDFELRRRMSKLPKESVAFVYETSPTKAFVGAFEIIETFHLPLEELWALVGPQSGTTYEGFSSYFWGRSTGSAIRIGQRQKLESPIGLDRIREVIKGFRPPQSYMFLRREKELFRVLRSECPHLF